LLKRPGPGAPVTACGAGPAAWTLAANAPLTAVNSVTAATTPEIGHPKREFMIPPVQEPYRKAARLRYDCNRVRLVRSLAMTDVTHTDPLLSPVSALRPAPKRAGYLFGPVSDFLLLGGGSVIACALIALVFPNGVTKASEVVLISILMLTINQPHFAHSYQIFYRNFRAKAFGTEYPRELRWRYVNAGLVVPAALIVFLATGIASGSMRLLAYGANLMFFLVGWHYVKQGYGILIVDSVQKRIMFDARAKTLLRLNGYACWMVAWLGLNHAIAKANPYLGLTYYTFPLPNAFYYTAIGIAAVTTLAALFVLARLWHRAGALPWNGIVAYLTTLYLWVIFVRFNPLVLVVVPTFHSLQYLAVVWRYQLNAGRSQTGVGLLEQPWLASVKGRFMLFVTIGVALGFLGFMGVPRTLDRVIGYDTRAYGTALCVFLAYIFINVHHYFLDNVMWRRGNPDVQRHIFSHVS
jgi:multisubunit Na+/H+ antiporter MnhC subunit